MDRKTYTQVDRALRLASKQSGIAPQSLSRRLLQLAGLATVDIPSARRIQHVRSGRDILVVTTVRERLEDRRANN